MTRQGISLLNIYLLSLYSMAKFLLGPLNWILSTLILILNMVVVMILVPNVANWGPDTRLVLFSI